MSIFVQWYTCLYIVHAFGFGAPSKYFMPEVFAKYLRKQINEQIKWVWKSDGEATRWR